MIRRDDCLYIFAFENLDNAFSFHFSGVREGFRTVNLLDNLVQLARLNGIYFSVNYAIKNLDFRNLLSVDLDNLGKIGFTSVGFLF